MQALPRDPKSHGLTVDKAVPECDRKAVSSTDRFGRDYFCTRSTYAALGEPDHASKLIARWYAGLFRHAFRRWGNYLPEEGRALDIGCGYGACLQLLAEQGFEPFGADISDFAVEVARQRAAAPPRVVVNDIQFEPPFPDHEFDLVICFEVLEHLERLDAAVTHIAECLCPGGIAWFTTPNPRFTIPPYDPWRDPTHLNVLPLEIWLELLRTTGFDSLVATTVIHLPVTYRLGRSLSLVIPTGAWGPTLLILARKLGDR
jgi:2-polyprenyl-3-methyl-5-hydroxy-6-metoxy-1,4-benzoquinol methylase